MPTSTSTRNRIQFGFINLTTQYHRKGHQMTITSTTPNPKSGNKTSEFYVTLIGTIFAFVNQIVGWTLPAEDLAILIAPIIAYIISRTVAKKPVAPQVIAAPTL